MRKFTQKLLQKIKYQEKTKYISKWKAGLSINCRLGYFVTDKFYYYKDKEETFASTYNYSTRIFDFLESEIGMPYPWQNYKQVPVKDFLYAGMENTSLNIYSDAFVVDSIAFVDKNFVNN